MSAWFARFLLFLTVCLTIAHGYPGAMSKSKWLQPRLERPHAVLDEPTYNYLNSIDGNDNDLNDSNGIATWLFRSRKFCCAPPL